MQRDLPLVSCKPCVQVYAIMREGSGQYDLVGQGALSIVTDEYEAQILSYLQVEESSDGGLLLRSRLRLENSYEKQKGSVIAWGDLEQRQHCELAVSFESEAQCDFFWRLICERIGKNFLDISGHFELPHEDNLTYILERTRSARDMINYHIANSPDFLNALQRTHNAFLAKGDKMGQGMITRIVKSLLSAVDLKLAHALLTQPAFTFLLEVHKAQLGIDFPRIWSERVRIKPLLSLPPLILQKVLIIHRANFYRESCLDLSKDLCLEQILMMSVIDCYKDIINYLGKDRALDELIELTENALQSTGKNTPEEETWLPEEEAVRRNALSQFKLDFFVQAFTMCRQVQSDKVRDRFIGKIYSSESISFAAGLIDQNIPKAVEFLVCLAQAAPARFLQYLRQKFRENPSDNLQLKLCKKYCLGSEQFQYAIIQVLRSLGESLSQRDNLQFFNGTFLTYVFNCCKDPNALLLILFELLQMVTFVEGILEHARRSKVIEKIVAFLGQGRRDKSAELRAAKVLKRVLSEHGGKDFTRPNLAKLNDYIINSGFFSSCMEILARNIHANNIISSSMLQNLKVIRDLREYSAYHQYLRRNYIPDETPIGRVLRPILERQPPAVQENESNKNYGLNAMQHELELENEREDSYLLEEANEEGPKEVGKTEETQSQLEAVRKLRMQISNLMEQEDEQLVKAQALRKMRKQVEPPTLVISLSLDFDESLDGNE